MDRNDALLAVLKHLAGHAGPGDFGDIETDDPRDNPAPEEIQLLRIAFDVDAAVLQDAGISEALGVLLQ